MAYELTKLREKTRKASLDGVDGRSKAVHAKRDGATLQQNLKQKEISMQIHLVTNRFHKK